MVGVMNKILISDEIVDCLCLGTSILMSLEALHQVSLGKTVLMVDKDTTFGGAWKTIVIDEVTDIENAIHYFLPDKKGIHFLKEVLKLPIETSKGKYRFFELSGLGYLKFPYSSAFGRFIQKYLHSNKSPGVRASLRHLIKCINGVISEKGERSYYLTTGAVGMLKSIQSLLDKNGVERRFKTNVTDIFFNLEKRQVLCKINGKTIITKSLIMGHGARLPSIDSTEGVLRLEEKFHPRPAFHLLVKDNKRVNVLEAVLTDDPLIKYVHDVSRFSSLNKNNITNKKIFVFALNSDVTDHNELPNKLFEKLRAMGLVGKKAKIISSLYSEVLLPTLDDEDLLTLKEQFGELIKVLKTENFAAGVGYYAEKWRLPLLAMLRNHK